MCLARAGDALLLRQMQRLILIGLAVCVLLGVAGVGGIWWMRQNRADSQWVPFPLNEETSREQRGELQKRLQDELSKPEILAKIVTEVGLQRKWGLPSEQDAMEQLKTSLFVREGEFKDPQTTMTYATMDVGVKGKYKEHALLGEIAVSLGKQTRIILGVPETP